MNLIRDENQVEKLVCLLRTPDQTMAAVVLCLDFATGIKFMKSYQNFSKSL